jgi:hypothetical protein
MKKILFALLAALMLLAVFAVTTNAEALEVAAEVAQGAEAVEQIAEGGLPTEPFTWSALGTIAGCTAFALLFVQLIKAPLDKVWKIPTRLLVYVVCLIVMILSVVFSGDGLTWASALLAAVNAVIPTLAAMGAYEVTFGRNHHD